jgi:hypothetical protein
VLWARSEAEGKAYELGNGLSDTYNRICRAYRDPRIDVAKEWRDVFDERRIERLKGHLHDLQSRLDPRAVTVVSDHLDAWQTRVTHGGDFNAPAVAAVRLLLRRQTLIWRQLLAGDKEPEAFLDHTQRATVRNELARMVWKRYLPWVPVLGAVVAVLLLAAANLGELSRWYRQNPAGTATLLASVAGALGITQASVGLSVRTRLRDWTELLWNRALAKRVTDVTLIVDQLLPVSKRPRVVQAAVHAGQRAGATTSRARGRIRADKSAVGAEAVRTSKP